MWQVSQFLCLFEMGPEDVPLSCVGQVVLSIVMLLRKRSWARPAILSRARGWGVLTNINFDVFSKTALSMPLDLASGTSHFYNRHVSERLTPYTSRDPVFLATANSNKRRERMTDVRRVGMERKC